MCENVKIGFISYLQSVLSFIPTPIWNREDITLRALRLLEELDVFFCEDTRTTKNLMRMYDIDYSKKKLYPFTSFMDERRVEWYVEMLQNTDCGVLSEAGTPWLSDPWKRLIQLCREHDLKFDILPGANALIPPVIATPYNTSKFVYMWFPPTKKGRQTFFTESIQYVSTWIPVYMYESVHRIEKTVKQLIDLWYLWNILIARELTKMHEEYISWGIEDIYTKITDGTMVKKWEFVVWLYP